jgi:LCP family protein required for cell wall assembly
LRRVLVVWAVLVVALPLVFVAGSVYAHYRYGQIKKIAVPGLRREVQGQAMNILLVGDNCRFCLNGSQTQAFGTEQDAGGAHSDVTMVLHLDPQRHVASVLSIPRDLVAPVPATTNALKIDAALNQGPTALVRTVQADLGIPVTHYMSLNFDTFQKVVAALGGVDMYFPVPVKDAYSALNIPTAGCRHLDGFQSLALVRARHLDYFRDGAWHRDGLSDLSRIRRDHTFLRVLAAAVEGKGLSNPLTLNAVLGSVTPNLKVDTGFSLTTMIRLVRGFHDLRPTDVPTYTLPVVVNPSSYYRSGTNDLGSVVLPSEPEDKFVIALSGAGPSASAPPPPPPSIAVQVVNASGITSQGARVAQRLAALGYRITGTSTAPPAARPSETVVYHASGHQAAALRVKDDLSGDVIMGENVTPPGVDVVVSVGSDISVAAPPQAPAPLPGTNPKPTGTTLPPPTPASQPPPSFDPVACPGK